MDADLLTCATCQHWRPSDSNNSRGECSIVLPPWVVIDMDEQFTWYSDSCDLHSESPRKPRRAARNGDAP